jgi:hypothetical protein
VKRVLVGVFAAAAILVGAVGAKIGADETFTIAFYKGRPHLLRFGPKARLGRCAVAETSDPTSDVLANLIDKDNDGRSDYRMTAFIDASPPSCEMRWAIFWGKVSPSQCHGASENCTYDPYADP